ncbi:MAG: PD-(D/E)XK nuclease family protein, partial [Clostridia bacterium]|nr:PD-(D/E)XK nuclease family protein [Clostridia bacterium]
MKAKVTFLIGRSGTGKSRMIRHRIRELSHAGGHPVLIVPEQFTFESEKTLSEFMGGGLLGIRVLSFTTLSRKVLASTGCNKSFLSPQGRRMVIRKLARARQKELRAFANIADRGGFAGECDSFFSLCKRFEMTPEQLTDAAERLGEGNRLGDKLHDFALLFSDMEGYLQDRYLDSEDAFRELIERLPQSDLVGEDVFINGFDLLTNQLYSTMGALMDTAKSLTVSIRMDTDESARDFDVFRPERRAYEKLRSMAEERGCRIEEVYFPLENAPFGGTREASPAMLHLERELFTPTPRPYKGEDCHVTLFSGSDPAAEVQALTAAVQEAAKSGIRYRDMAVIAADMGGYATAIRRAFREEGIPVFTDAKHPIKGHPAVELCLSALRLIGGGFSKSDYLRLVKTELAGVSREDAEILENYLLRYGITGKRLLEPFTRGEVPEAAERARLTLQPPLERLRLAMHERSAAQKTRALFAFLQELNVAEQLTALADALFEAGRFEEAEETAQIWNILMELLDQLHVILGDLSVSHAEYLSLFSEGLDAYEVGVIPTTADQVLLGGVSRTRSRAVRALFIVGAAEGRFPSQHADDAIVDDNELKRLADMGLAPWGGTLIRTENDRLDLYNVFSRVSERLYFSWPMNVDGAAMEKAELFEKLDKIFPNAKRESDVGGTAKTPVSRTLAKEPLIRALRAYADTGIGEENAADLYAEFAAEDPEFLRRVSEALFFASSPKDLPQDLARELYGSRIRASATRLETFNGCPFRHFARYGLGLQERQEYEERPIDEGT